MEQSNFTKGALMQPVVSVIITCYNYGKYLQESVESVISQTFQDFEIIIVNDGSIDNTEQIAVSLIQRYSNHKISLLNQENSGQPAIARNNGIEKSHGEYIFCLDADDRIAPTFIEKCLNLLKNNPHVSIAYTDRLDFDGVDEIVKSEEYDFEKLKYQNHISYCALYPRRLWQTVGGYRTNVKGCEDWDFWIAAGLKGYYGKRIAEPLFHYRRHDTGVFQDVSYRLNEVHAQIVLNNQDAFTQDEIKKAKSIISRINLFKDRNIPTVSVIIPTYNRPDRLSRALKSVLGQTFRNFEIIVINDGGNDVKGVIDFLNKDSYILYVNKSKNQGLSSARNTGLKLARGKYIAYLDDDDLFYPDHLETLVGFLESTSYRVAYSDAYRTVYQNSDIISNIIDKSVFYSGEFDKERIFVENFIPVLCFVHEKSCIDEVGMFDESLTSHEDWEFWIKMSLKFPIGHVAKITCEFTTIIDTVKESQKRKDFLSTLKIIYDRYREHVIGKPNILQAQISKLLNALIWAYGHIDNLEKEKIKLLHEINLLNYNVNASQSNLTWRLLNKYIFPVWDKFLIPFGSKRRAILEKLLLPKVENEREDLTSKQLLQINRKRIIKKAANQKEIKKIFVYSNSSGNYFFREIRDLILSGIKALGYNAEARDENSWLCDEDAWHIVVAPHEFFYLTNIKNRPEELLPENLIIVNTEQPSTRWYLLSNNYFPFAKFIWDINYESAVRLKEQNFECSFLPLGYLKDFYLFQEIKQLPHNYATSFLDEKIKNQSYLFKSFKERPIDLAFVGAKTIRREEFFVKNAATLSSYRSYFHLSEGMHAPLIPGINTNMNTETVIGVMQRSKIMLNIHHGRDKYFEWHRIVILGIAQRTLVISEPCSSPQILEPGIDYIEVNLKNFSKKINYYLRTENGVKEAEKIIDNAYNKLKSKCSLVNQLKPLLEKLYIVSN